MESKEVLELKEGIINRKDELLAEGILAFKDIQPTLKEDLRSLEVLFDDIKEELNLETIKDIHRITFDMMQGLYHIDNIVSSFFTTRHLEETGKVGRLYSAFENLLDYDEEFQSDMEGNYE